MRYVMTIHGTRNGRERVLGKQSVTTDHPDAYATWLGVELAAQQNNARCDFVHWRGSDGSEGQVTSWV